MSKAISNGTPTSFLASSEAIQTFRLINWILPVSSLNIHLVLERARKDPKFQFTSLANLLNEKFLKECYFDLGRDRASGIGSLATRPVVRTNYCHIRKNTVPKRISTGTRGGTRNNYVYTGIIINLKSNERIFNRICFTPECEESEPLCHRYDDIGSSLHTNRYRIMACKQNRSGNLLLPLG
jgi:hypothetical protein